MSPLPDRKSIPGAGGRSVNPRNAAGKSVSPSLFEIGKNVLLRVGKDNLSLIAAGVAFYAMTAIFPAIAALVSVYGLFADPRAIERQLTSYADLLPANSLTLLTDALENFARNSHSTLNAALVVSVVLALWSAKAGVSSLMTGLNIANKTPESVSCLVPADRCTGADSRRRPSCNRRPRHSRADPRHSRALPLGTASRPLVGFAEMAPLAILVCLGPGGLAYRFGPRRNIPRGNGSLGAPLLRRVCGWRVPLFFSFYVSHFGAYDRTYGALAAPVILLLWFWLGALAVLVGAATDAELEYANGARSRPSPTGVRRPSMPAS